MDSLINLDQNIFYWFNSLVGLSQVLDWIIKVVAVYAVYAVPVVMVYYWFRPTPPRRSPSGHLRGDSESEKTQKFLMNLLVSVIISWQVIARILGQWINRPRPEIFSGAKEVFFHPPTYAFPSDHALFFAFITTYLYLSGYKKMAGIALAATIIISLARVIGGLHWPGDILAGWLIGGFLAMIFWQLRGWIERWFAYPLLMIAKKLKLA